MKIFLAWSGAASKELASLLWRWLPEVIQDLEPFMSEENVRSGKRWLDVIGSQLSETNFAIPCLTPTNLRSRWIHFEAGAASKVLRESSVCCLLYNLAPSDIEFPLAQFQSRTVSRLDLERLLKDIDQERGEKKLGEVRLARSIENSWSAFEQGLQKVGDALKAEGLTQVAPARQQSEILNDLVSGNQGLSTQLAEQRELLKTIIDRQLIATGGFPTRQGALSAFLSSADSGVNGGLLGMAAPGVKETKAYVDAARQFLEAPRPRGKPRQPPRSEEDQGQDKSGGGD